MRDLNTIISEFVSGNLSPTDDEKKGVSHRYEQLSGLLKGVNFQSGSYARFTAVTPVHDLDVIWVLPESTVTQRLRKSFSAKIDPADLDVKNILEDLARRLDAEYKKLGEQVKITSQTHSVTIEFIDNSHDFTIDVVPAVPTEQNNEFGDPLFIVPEIIRSSHLRRVEKYANKEKIDWIKSDPKGYIEEATELDEKNEAFRKSTKFLKSWKDKLKSSNDEVKLKSFHIEQSIVQLLHTTNLDTLRTIKTFIDNLNTYLSEPQITDRANPQRFIDAYVADLSEAQIKVLLTSAADLKEAIEKCESVNSELEINEIFNELACPEEELEVVYPIKKSYEPAKQWCDNHE